MKENLKKTLEYIEKRLSELDIMIYGDDTEEGDECALINNVFTPDFINYESERRTLYYIKQLLTK